MKVENLMVRDVHTCRPEDGLSVPASIMSNHDCGCVPVIDEDYRVLGMITDRDICMAGLAQGKPLSAIETRSAMARAPRTCKPGDDVAQAEKVMRTAQVRRLPVVGDDGRLAGLISLNDLACEAVARKTRREVPLTAEEVGLTLAAICAHRRPSDRKSLPPQPKPEGEIAARGASRARSSSRTSRTKRGPPAR